MKDCRHVRLTGTIRLSLPAARAFPLFTPSGERAWVEDWDPIFHAAVEDETEPGTVFETNHGGTHTIWVVVRRDQGNMIEYARITPGDRAGLVRVAFESANDHETLVTVSYELTALKPEANDALDDFAENYGEFLEDWSRLIRRKLRNGWTSTRTTPE